ncbi:MAG: hypothetical protein QE263_04645 [Vampirovibrionales bacterium]|nr:hypothetical protein [Vampirovibrionales bacterium]
MNNSADTASKQAYQEISFTLAASQSVVYNINGRSLSIDTISGSGLTMSVDDGSFSTVQQGSGFELPEGEEFRKVSFNNTSASSVTITLAVSRSKLSTRVSLSGSVSVTSGATPTTPAVVTAATAATVLVAASTSRRSVMVQNLHGSDNLWVGNANVGNDAGPRGLRVPPGGSLSLATGGALWCRRGGANDITVGVLEIAQ